MLHGVFKHAVRDRVIAHNSCAETELPKVGGRKTRTVTPEEIQRLLAAIPDRFKVLVMTEIETGQRHAAGYRPSSAPSATPAGR